MIAEAGKYRIESDKDANYTAHSSDNLFKYDRVYFDQSEYDFQTQIGLKIYKHNDLITSVIIGSMGGFTSKRVHILEKCHPAIILQVWSK